MGMTREEARHWLKIELKTWEDECKSKHPIKEALEKAIEALEQEPKTVTVKQLEEMYDSYETSLWREHEDVRGDDMVELGTAKLLLQEELCILGCWDDEVEE